MTDPVRLTAVLGGTGETGCAYLVRRLLSQGSETKTALMTSRHSCLVDRPLPRPDGMGWRDALSDVLEGARRMGCTHAVLTLPWDRLWAGEAADLTLETAVVTELREEDADRTADYLQTHARQLACNLDDPAVRRLVARWNGPCCTYAETRPEADVAGRNLRLLPERTEFDALTRKELCRVSLPVAGGFDLYQGLAALSWGQLHGLPLTQCADLLRQAEGEPGRMEIRRTADGKRLLLDRAETPEALETLLLTARNMTRRRLLLILTVPCGASPALRWELGLIARLSDRVCFTGQTPLGFFRELRLGAGVWRSVTAASPQAALQWALAQTTPEDLVVLAGAQTPLSGA